MPPEAAGLFTDGFAQEFRREGSILHKLFNKTPRFRLGLVWRRGGMECGRGKSHRAKSPRFQT